MSAPHVSSNSNHSCGELLPCAWPLAQSPVTTYIHAPTASAWFSWSVNKCELRRSRFFQGILRCPRRGRGRLLFFLSNRAVRVITGEVGAGGAWDIGINAFEDAKLTFNSEDDDWWVMARIVFCCTSILVRSGISLELMERLESERLKYFHENGLVDMSEEKAGLVFYEAKKKCPGTCLILLTQIVGHFLQPLLGQINIKESASRLQLSHWLRLARK